MTWQPSNAIATWSPKPLVSVGISQASLGDNPDIPKSYYWGSVSWDHLVTKARKAETTSHFARKKWISEMCYIWKIKKKKQKTNQTKWKNNQKIQKKNSFPAKTCLLFKTSPGHPELFFFLFIYSHVHTLFGSFLPPVPNPHYPRSPNYSWLITRVRPPHAPKRWVLRHWGPER
jgi:hypothetical protein